MSVRKSTMGPESRALINYLQAHGPTSIAVLLQVFPEQEKYALNKRLHNLRSAGWLQSEGERGAMVWSMHPEACRLLPALQEGVLVTAMRAQMRAKTQPKAKPKQDPKPVAAAVFSSLAHVLQRTPCVSYEPYVPKTTVSCRPGAMDFQRCASRGVRC